MAIIFVRSLLIYTILLIVMRFMGKRQIGEMQPFEFVVTLLIAELACIPMSDVSIPLLYGVSAILAVFVIHQVMALLEKSGRFIKFVISGKPSLVVDKNGINFKELKKNNLDVSDLMESLRTLGYYNLSSIKYAIYESNGTLTAVSDDSKEKTEMSILLVKDGKPILRNLQTVDQAFSEITAFIKKQGARVQNVGVFTVDGVGNYYLQEYEKPFKVGKFPLKEEVKW